MILDQTALLSKYVRFSAHRVASINHFWMWLQQKKIFIQIPWGIRLIIFEDKLTRSAVILMVYIYEKNFELQKNDWNATSILQRQFAGGKNSEVFKFKDDVFMETETSLVILI